MTQEDVKKYLVSSKTQAVKILESLISEVAIISVHYANNKEVTTTTVLEVRPDQVILEHGPDKGKNNELLHSRGWIIFIAQQGQGKIQFAANSISNTTHKGSPAFTVPFPKNLYRVQRRSYFRVQTPTSNPILCRLRQRDNQGFHTVKVVDLSVGGLGFEEPVLVIPFAKGQVFEQCTMDIPDIGNITFDLVINSAYKKVLKTGKTVIHIGTSFKDIDQGEMSKLQRYINVLERMQHKVKKEK